MPSRQHAIVQFSITICLIALSTYSLFIVVVCFTLLSAVLILYHGRVARQNYIIYVILASVIAIGTISGAKNFSSEHWAYLRDTVYIAKFGMLIFVASQISAMVSRSSEINSAVIISAAIIAGYYILSFHMLDAANEMTRREIRLEIGRGSYLWPLAAFLITIDSLKRGSTTDLSRLSRLLALTLCAWATLYSDSRTLPGIYLIFVVTYALRNHGLAKTAVLFVVAILATALSFSPVLDKVGQIIYALNSQILIDSFGEQVTLSFGSRELIQSNFRAYEAYKGWQVFSAGTVIQQIVGHGFGYSIPIDTYISLGLSSDDQAFYTSIPFTHNSGPTALVKFGILGFILYIVLPITIYFNGLKAGGQNSYIQAGLCLSIYYSYITFQGLFSILDVITIPFFLAFLHPTHKRRLAYR